MPKKVLAIGQNSLRYDRMDEWEPVLSKVMRNAGFDVTLSEDLGLLVKEKISEYDVLLMHYAGGKTDDFEDRFTLEQLQGLITFVESGGGFLPMHSVTDAFRSHPEFAEIIGGIYWFHRARQDQVVKISDPSHPIVRGVTEFTIFDEQYLLNRFELFDELCKPPNNPSTLLLHTELPEEEAKKIGKSVVQPIAWVKKYGEGKVFYFAPGHDEKALNHPSFQKVLVQGLEWLST